MQFAQHHTTDIRSQLTLRRSRLLATGSFVCFALACAVSFSDCVADAADKVDFGRDVLPLFRTHCIDCHGPNLQQNSFRLDRRADAMRGGTGTMIGAGDSAASRLYLKLIGDQAGQQMPPDGPLAHEEIELIKRWIDQGAKWPDELAGERPVTVPDPQAAAVMNMLREGDRPTFQKMLRDHPEFAKLKGPGGSTPLMYAVLYADSQIVRQLLNAGADPNSRNDAGATALMWAVGDLEMTKLLIERGADVNAVSDDSRTPLLIAAGRPGAEAVVKLLLEHGADPSAKAPSYRGPISPLRLAADRGDEELLKLLIERGADVHGTGPLPFISAVNTSNTGSIDLLIESGSPAPLNMSLIFISPPFGEVDTFGDEKLVEALIKRGGDVNARDRAGRTVLMLAATLDSLPVESIRMLLKHGADINAKAPDGRTALDFALQRGTTPVVELLLEAGAKEGVAPRDDAVKPKPATSVGAALERSIPLLQRVDANFFQKSGCVSCHHNSFTEMTVSLARKHGLPVNESIEQQQLAKVKTYLDGWRERALQDSGIPGDSDSISPTLVGLAAENYPPDATTDALAHYVKSRQRPDGHWHVIASRPPLEAGDFWITAASLRSLQVYAPKARRAEYESAIQLATDWLKQAQPRTTQDRAYQLLGLCWSGLDGKTIHNATRALLDEQHEDGGWSSLPTLSSDAYSTGLAMVALHESGIPANDPAYQSGVRYLMQTQFEDGSWHVRSRALPFQPYFESGFPHGADQWISAAATNWAAMALIPAAQ